MNMVLFGASGFIGNHLKPALRTRDHELTIVYRDGFQKSEADFLKEYIDNQDVVINLSGAPISKKWSESYKTEILNSRVDTTRKICNAILAAKNPPSLFINASAVGIYDGSEMHTEESQALSSSFLGKVCKEWEAEAWRCHDRCRVVMLRLGLVLSKDEGVLEKMTTPFKQGIGARIGNGEQGVSFIHIGDLIRVFLFVMEHPELVGPVNAVAEYSTDNYYFSEMLGKVFGQPVYFTIPKMLVRMKMGESAMLLTEGQRVVPKKLKELGFTWEYPTIDKALVGIFRDPPKEATPLKTP